MAEWQTHQTQNLTGVTSCGFKSHYPHSLAGARRLQVPFRGLSASFSKVHFRERERSSMDCHEAQKMITRYIRGELNRTETDEFLDHVMNCKECYDELEIYYTIDMGLKELDGVEAPRHSLQESIDLAMRESRAELHINRTRFYLYYITSNIVFWVVFAAALAELYRIWLFWR